MVMSLGWNPFYKNERRSAEVHILHAYAEDFYGCELRVVVAGYIRPERNFASLAELIDAINNDIALARNSLARPAYQALKDSDDLKPTSAA
ncbi:hypothetical protein HK405_000109 [Cladochytrium tenue]|nr:hypothetical protein HK405_000109 [Cladochytrium tenue]